MFPTRSYQNRRKALINNLDSGLVLLLGNEMSSINYPDQHYPFRQDSSFLYYCGIDRPGLAAVIDLDAGECSLFGDEYSLEMLVWIGDQTTLEELSQNSGIEHIQPSAKLAPTLAEAQKQGREIHFLPPYRPENTRKLHEWLGMGLDRIQSAASVRLIDAVIQQRSYKSEEEVAQMIMATDLSGRMHRAAMAHTRPGLMESDVMAKAYAEAHAANSRPAYGVICTVHGEVLHNEFYHHKLGEEALLLLDAGGESPFHYAGDITRTWPVSGRFNEQQKEIYQVVESALRDAAESLMPGVKYRDVHLQAAEQMFEGLKGIGLTKGDPKQAVAEGAQALFFPHGLGHHIGLDVHDMEDLGEDRVGYGPAMQRSSQFGLKSLRLGRELEPGFTLTVEPGIYFIPKLIDAWKAEQKFADFIRYDALDAYRNFGGIRLENDYLITEEGARLLGEPIPLRVEEVEAAMAQ